MDRAIVPLQVELNYICHEFHSRHLLSIADGQFGDPVASIIRNERWIR